MKARSRATSMTVVVRGLYVWAESLVRIIQKVRLSRRLIQMRPVSLAITLSAALLVQISAVLKAVVIMVM